eukprot:1990458-Amphidinium_carterae.1
MAQNGKMGIPNIPKMRKIPRKMPQNTGNSKKRATPVFEENSFPLGAFLLPYYRLGSKMNGYLARVDQASHQLRVWEVPLLPPIRDNYICDEDALLEPPKPQNK